MEKHPGKGYSRVRTFEGNEGNGPNKSLLTFDILLEVLWHAQIEHEKDSFQGLSLDISTATPKENQMIDPKQKEIHDPLIGQAGLLLFFWKPMSL